MKQKELQCITLEINKSEKLMQPHKIYGKINTVAVVGYGSIGRGVLPLMKRHFQIDKICIVDPHPVQQPQEDQTVKFYKTALKQSNYQKIFEEIFDFSQTNFMVSVSVSTSSSQLMQYCQKKNILYVDTVKEEWDGFYQNDHLSIEKRSNYWMREDLNRDVRNLNLPTTVITCCGANPGMVSWFVKKAMMNLASDMDYKVEKQPQTRLEWAYLMKNLGIKGVHIAERDTQTCKKKRPIGQFWNTWSIEGFLSEGFYQPCELGWGSHEKWMPKNAIVHKEGCQAAIMMAQPGMNTMIKCWCPTFGPQMGFLVTHEESICIPDYYTIKDEKTNELVYRPTVHYAYHPCAEAQASSLECLGKGYAPEPDKWKILEQEIDDGIDELGVFLYGHPKNGYWYGSQLSIHDTRKRAPKQNATGLQVTSSVIAAMVWALQNPKKGLVEPDEMDYKRCLEVIQPYIDPIRGYYTDWTPLDNKRNLLKEDDFDLDDPWQFSNIIMHK